MFHLNCCEANLAIFDFRCEQFEVCNCSDGGIEEEIENNKVEIMSSEHKTIITGNPSQYVKLNVGGHLYYTTIATLTSKSDTMLQAMFSGRMEVLTDAEGKGSR